MTRALDRTTLDRARAGDPAAFRRLYDSQVGFTYRFLRRFLSDDSAAEDALQETFLRVHRALRGFDTDGRASLSTWILTIARRVAITASANRPPVSVEAPAAPIDNRADELGDLRRALDAAVSALPEAQRSVFVLHEGCGLAYEEIAAIEEIDLGTVRSRLHRARAALQERLRDHLPPSDRKEETNARRATTKR